jgi:hypothetical protein
VVRCRSKNGHQTHKHVLQEIGLRAQTMLNSRLHIEHKGGGGLYEHKNFTLIMNKISI